MNNTHVTNEIRSCIVELFGEKKKALFHAWTLNNGDAIVEFENGKCGTVDAWSVSFTDSK